MRTYRLLGLLALFALVVGAVAGAGTAGKAGPDAGQRALGGERLSVGFVIHVRGNPFIQQIIDGAVAAGQDLGVDVRVAGPPDFDAEAQLKQIDDLVASGVDGVATSIPGESMVRRLREIQRSGKPVATFNLRSKSLQAPYVGERSTASGRLLGRLVARRIGASGGKVILGICAPGLGVLENRARGVKQSLAKVRNIQVRGAFDVKVAANENFAAWEQLYAANTDTKGMIGMCAPDVASLGKLNRQVDNKIVAGGYDTTAENFAAIEAGRAYVTLGQTPFVQGYMPVKMIVDSLRSNRPMKVGFLESGTEVLTKAGATEPYGLGKLSFAQVKRLANSKAATRTYYNRLVKNILRNYRSKLEPLANESK